MHIVVSNSHENTIAIFWICFATSAIIIGVIIAYAIIHYNKNTEQANVEIEKAKAEARKAEAIEKQINGKGPEEYERIANAATAQAKAIQKSVDALNGQTEALERFMAAREQMVRVLDAEDNFKKEAKKLL